MGRFPIHVNLVHQVELDIIFCADMVLNHFIRVCLLVVKLIAGKSQDVQSIFLKLLMQLGQLLVVLFGEGSSTRHVYD